MEVPPVSEKNIELEVKNLCKYYAAGRHGVLKAVDDVSFEIYTGETLGIVGESGCGKTTCGKTCIGMLPKTAGSVKYKGKDVHTLSKKERFDFTRKVQMIFQDPYASLDPHQKVYGIVAEGIRTHKLAESRAEEERMVLELLDMVGLNSEHAMRNVHEFSGGQRQRIVIARALATSPHLLLCDEAVSALDVSVRAQVLNLFETLKEELDLTYVFVSHDMSVLEHICDRVAIMYLGKIVEIGDKDTIFNSALHPYTQALLSAVPSATDDGPKRERIILEGDIPSPVNPPEGCHFRTRCPYATEECMTEPELTELGNGHCVACHRCKAD